MKSLFKDEDVNEFDNEKQKLASQIRIFSKKGPHSITKLPHSFFGPMSPEEQGIIQAKHLGHHLTQFGV